MLENFISPRNLIWLQGSELNEISDNYFNYLKQQGYSDKSILIYIHSVAHFAYWLENNKISLSLVNETTMNQFLFEHLPVCDCSRICSRTLFNARAALRHLLKVLRAEHRIPIFSPVNPAPMVEELARYKTYLNEVCGLAKSTQISRLHYVRAFLHHKFGRRSIAVRSIKPKDILGFIAKSSERFKPATIRVIAVALRSYLRFRAFVGDHTQPLIAAVPSVAHWQLATIPKTISPANVKRLLNTFDRDTPIGKRDYAMGRCLVDLGLRAGEVARLQINDVDWRGGTLRIKGAKGKRIQLLPLPSQTGKAIVNYLRFGRLTTTSRTLFVRHRAGVNCPVGTGTVCARIRLASIQCGISPPVGAHVLRHSVACRMLHAGASLKDIADVLLHRNLDTTMIYAKVDLTQLALVAAPWPGELP